MKRLALGRWSVLTCAGAFAFFVLAPIETTAFTINGTSLAVDQRDVRVFDNFTTSTNTTPDPNWPGAVGAPLAIWKAVAEWGSELHGDGSGDPSQPGDVGSGGANFDVTWQGLAPSAGTTTGNVVSEFPGCGGGILVFSEIGPNGWRTFFCGSFNWFDGPGTNVPAGAIDLQGVMCREYGRLLGLGNSSVSGSTMSSASSGNGVAARSIEADDRAGVQAIYGAISPQKPHVASISGTTTLTIVGTNFSPTNNEVWFTEAGSNPTGDPVKVIGLSSTGTQIVLALPANAGPGDVLVRVPGAGGATLSNAFPFAPNGCGVPATYCVAKTNSQGCTPSIGFTGTPSASSAAPFLITAAGVINQKPGFLLYAFSTAATSFQGGTLCLGGALRRTPPQNSGGSVGPADCSGTFAFDFNARIQSGIDPFLVVGTNVDAQYYYRDPADPFGVGLTDALALTICP